MNITIKILEKVSRQLRAKSNTRAMIARCKIRQQSVYVSIYLSVYLSIFRLFRKKPQKLYILYICMYVYVYINEWEKQSNLFARYISLSFTEASSKTVKYLQELFFPLFVFAKDITRWFYCFTAKNRPCCSYQAYLEPCHTQNSLFRHYSRRFRHIENLV